MVHPNALIPPEGLVGPRSAMPPAGEVVADRFRDRGLQRKLSVEAEAARTVRCLLDIVTPIGQLREDVCVPHRLILTSHHPVDHDGLSITGKHPGYDGVERALPGG